jgi:hypothetical protein
MCQMRPVPVPEEKTVCTLRQQLLNTFVVHAAALVTVVVKPSEASKP